MKLVLIIERLAQCVFGPGRLRFSTLGTVISPTIRATNRELHNQFFGNMSVSEGLLYTAIGSYFLPFQSLSRRGQSIAGYAYELSSTTLDFHRY